MQYYTEYLTKKGSKLMTQYAISNESAISNKSTKTAFEDLRLGLRVMSLLLLK